MRRLTLILAALLLGALPLRAADITVTAANVAKGANAQVTSGTAGETITAGMPVYLASDGKLYKALSSGTALQATFAGIALHASLAGQPLTYQTSGTVTIGGTVAVGTFYVVSANAGGVAPVADLVSTNYVTLIGYGTSSTVITLAPNATGVTKP